MSEGATGREENIELLPVWDGPVEHAPGVLFEEPSNEGMLFDDAGLLSFAAWVAVTALSGIIGNTAFVAIRAHVRAVLNAWRREEGKDQLNRLKDHVLTEMQKHRPNGKLTEQELKERIDTFFEEIQER
jgi:hypothetical protein